MSVDPKTIALDKCLQRRPITFAKFCRSQLTGFDTLTAAFGTGVIGGGRRKTSSPVMLTGKWPATLDKRTPAPWLARSGPELVESQFAALRSSAHAWLTPLTILLLPGIVAALLMLRRLPHTIRLPPSRPALAVAGCEAFSTGQMTRQRANNSRVMPRVRNLGAG